MKIEHSKNGIVWVNGEIVGVMYDPKKTNMYKVLFKHYKQQLIEFLKECGKAAAYAIHR